MSYVLQGCYCYEVADCVLFTINRLSRGYVFTYANFITWVGG